MTFRLSVLICGLVIALTMPRALALPVEDAENKAAIDPLLGIMSSSALNGAGQVASEEPPVTESTTMPKEWAPIGEFQEPAVQDVEVSQEGAVHSGHAGQYGNWIIGDKGEGHFVINSPNRDPLPQLLIRQDSMLFRAARWGLAPATWGWNSPNTDSVRLGEWIMGEKGEKEGFNHFVIAKRNSGICQFLVRSDSMIFVLRTGKAPDTWRHHGPSATVLQFGDWLVGPRDNNHFVISHTRTHITQFLIRHDGLSFFDHEWGIAPTEWALRALPGGSCGNPSNVRGTWNYVGYTNGQREFSYTTGTTTTDGSERSSSWEVGVQVEVSHGFKFLGGVDVEVTSSYSRGGSETISRSIEQSSETSLTTTFPHEVYPHGGVVWQFDYLTQDACGAGTIQTTDLVITPNRAQRPCCLPGYARNPGQQHGPCAGNSPCSCSASVCRG